MSGDSQAVIDCRKRRKLNLVLLMGGKCCLCGYDKCITALEFHHLDPEEKLYGLGSGTPHSIESDIAEVRKTILVCANCHREIESGFYELEYLKNLQKIDEDFAIELLSKGYEQPKKEYFCIQCNKKLYDGKGKTGLCPECYAKTLRRAERPTREELKELVRTLPFTQIGIKYNVSDNAIRKWCDAENIPRTKKEIVAYSDEEWSLI